MARKPTVKKVSLKGLVYALAGKEPPYDVYRFGRGKVKYERPQHNPFAGTDTTAPGAPERVTVQVVSGTEVSIVWSPVIDNNGPLSGYILYRDSVPLATLDGNVTSYFDDSVLPDTQYNYQVSAVDNAGTEGALSAGTVADTDLTAPTVPANMSAIAADYQTVDVDWDPSTDAVGVAGYRLYRDGALIATYGPGTTVHQDTGLTEQTQYIYQVEAFDAAGNVSALTAAIDGTVTTPAQNVDPNWIQGDPIVVIAGPSVTLTDDTPSSAYSNMFNQAFSAGGKFAVQFVLGDSFSVADSSTMYLGFRATGWAESTVTSFYWCALELDLNGVSFFRYTISGSAGIDIDNMPGGIGPGSIITLCIDADNLKMYINIDGTWLTKAGFGGAPAGGNGIDIVGGAAAVKPCIASTSDGTASHTTEILYGAGVNIPAGYTFLEPGWV